MSRFLRNEKGKRGNKTFLEKYLKALDKRGFLWYNPQSRKTTRACSSVDRVPGYEPVGRRFESCQARQIKEDRVYPILFYFSRTSGFRTSQRSALKGLRCEDERFV